MNRNEKVDTMDLTEDEKRWQSEILAELEQDPMRCLNHYCHEGLQFDVMRDNSGRTRARLCSVSAEAPSKEGAIKALAEKVRQMVYSGTLGC